MRSKAHKEKDRMVTSVQKLSIEMVAEIRNLRLPSLGPDFGTLSGTDLQDSLVGHRFSNKFEVPDGKVSSARRTQSISAMLEADSRHPDAFSLFDLSRPSRVAFINSQEFLKKIKVKKTYRAVFPSGETVVSAGGNTDLYRKLADEAQWQVSIDALDYAAKICYHNLFLKRLVRERFTSLSNDNGVRDQYLKRWYLESVEAGKFSGFYCFKRMFAYCCEITGYDRITTVPKNNSSDRVISCVAFWTMVAQLSYARDLRDALKTATGIDLSYWQEVHRSLIRSGNSTIDFSAASDSNLWVHVEKLFPKNIVSDLRKLRTGIFLVEDDYVPVKMFAPMGCGMTFEVLTLTLLAYSRSFDVGSTVFGDDVIISPEAAPSFIDFVEELGWKVNTSKSFLTGNFRESCGGFCDLVNDKMILSYDITYPTSRPDCFILANKVARLVQSMEPSRLRSILMRYYVSLHKIIPSDAFVGYMSSGVLSEYSFLTPMAAYCTKTNTSPLVHLWEEMWQRPVRLCTIQHRSAVTSPLKRDFVTTLRSVCFFRRGRSYAIPTGKFKTRSKTIDVETGVSLSSLQLVSVVP